MHKIVNESCILVHMGCVVWSLYWICWVWKGWREPSIAPGGDILSGGALTCGWGMMGKVADPLALWPFCLPIVEEKKMGSSSSCWRVLAKWILIFSKSVLCCVEGFAHSDVLVAAVMVKSLTESREVTKFHPLRSLSAGIPGCITNFNPWPLGAPGQGFAEWGWLSWAFGTEAAVSAGEYPCCSAFQYPSQRNQWCLQKLQHYWNLSGIRIFPEYKYIIMKSPWPWQFVSQAIDQ